MQVTIPKIVRELPMQDYAAELGEQKLFVWVNPTRAKLLAYDELVEEMGEKLKKKVSEESKVPEGSEEPTLRKNTTGQAAPDEQKDAEAAGLKLDAQLREWYAELLSQGPGGTECSAADLLRLAEMDPACSVWIMRRCWQLISAQRAGQKKA
jgi:hypothetical protein